MGQCLGREISKEQKDEMMKERLINKGLKEDAKEEERKVKLLLLGPGESGKSTLFKQMRLNYMKPLAPDDLSSTKEQVWRNVIENFKLLVTICRDESKSLGAIDHFKDKWCDIDINTPLPIVIDDVKALWRHPVIQKMWEERWRYQLLDSIEVFCNDLDRISSPSYEPTTQDFLLSRVRTTGMTEQSFFINKVEFVIIDVGGQRSERRKWIQCFDNVTAILFVAAVNDFDQTLFEDTNQNRMKEALQLMKNVLNFKVFRETPIILFLNKIDLFERKLKDFKARNVNLDNYFPELRLGTNYNGAQNKILDHMKSKFEELAKSGKIYTHQVTATHTDNFKIVFEATVEIVLSKTIHAHFYV